MGILIFTRDATPYRVGQFVEGDGVVCSPACEDLTLIVHEKRPKKDECLAWLPYVAYRMVFVCDKAPDLKNHPSVIFDRSMSGNKDNYMPKIQSVLRWKDRDRAWAMARKVPPPLMLAFLRENNTDISLWRLLAKGFAWTPADYQMAAIIYGTEPVSHTSYPKKKKSGDDTIPHGFRGSDRYAQIIAEYDHKVGNDIRTKAKETMPKSAKKKKQKVVDWL
jgi:hypothetical protein